MRLGSNSRITLPKISLRSSASFATTAISLLTLGPSALLAASFWIHPPPPRDPPTVTVLCYHNFDAKKKTPYTIESKRFHEQMRYLHVQHLPVIPLAQLVEHLHSGAALPSHAVVITIDDGYKTARTKALPILREFGFPFTVFIYPQFIGRPSALSWGDVRVLAQAGVDIQSHSLTHPLLTHPSKVMSQTDYRAWIDHELRESKRIIERHIGKPVTSLAYPFGGYDEQIVERTRQAGYQAALTCDDGNITRQTDPWHINRRLVYHHVRFKEFSEYFPDQTLQVADLTPRDGQRLHTPVAALEARVINMDQVLPGSGTILVDKAGRRRFLVDIDPKTGHFRFPLPSKRGYYFVSLFARDRANPALRREASWLFIISRNASKN